MEEEQKVEHLKRIIIDRLERIRTMDEFKQAIQTYFKVDVIKPILSAKLDEWIANKANYKTTIDEQISDLEGLKEEAK